MKERGSSRSNAVAPRFCRFLFRAFCSFFVEGGAAMMVTSKNGKLSERLFSVFLGRVEC
jgi:hypothetical protein